MKKAFKQVMIVFVILNLMLGQTLPVLAQEGTPETPTPTPSETQPPVTEEATGIPSPSETPTETPTETPIPTGSLTETPTETLTPTPTGEGGTETATPTPASETPIPSVTPTEEIPAYTFTLSSDPVFLDRAGDINLSWIIEGAVPSTGSGQVPVEAPLTVEILLPVGFKIVNKADRKWFNAATSVFTMPVTTPQGSLALRTNRVSEDAIFLARLLSGAEELAANSLLLPFQERFEVSKLGEGRVEAMKGKVRVIFPNGSLDEDIVLNAGFPSSDRLPKNGFSGNVFELRAKAKRDEKREVKRFKTPLTIEVDYSGMSLSPEQEDELYLYWYNEVTGDWHALESSRDKTTKTLTATSDHFTVFDIGVNDWNATRLPTIDSFQVSEFTGAATFSLPIEVPPGPGGFQPNINLSYNSQVVDQATTKAQASWVGMGWSLDGGGSVTKNGDGQYAINANGISMVLMQEEAGGDFHAESENFWKIDYVDNTAPAYWKVYDTQGNQYIFENIVNPNSGNPYEWHLTKMANTFGQELQYSYTTQTKTINGNSVVTAAYISAITYPNQRYRVRFVTTSRYDYTAAWDTDAAFHVYEKYRLANIYVEQDADGNGTFETTIRRYGFTYAGNTDTDIIWPGIIYTAGTGDGKANTLRSVQEFSGGSALPAHKFTYGDNLHLTKAENGYGGIVQFVYESIPFSHTATAASYEKVVPGCAGGAMATSWVIMSGTQSANCTTNPGWLTVTNGKVRNPYYTNNSIVPENQLVRPGGVYQIEYTAIQTAGSSYQVGLYNQNGSNNVNLVSSSGGTTILAKDAKTVETYFKATGTARFSNMTVRLMPSFYRVKQKIVSDSNSNSYTYNYDYTSPKVVVENSSYRFYGHREVKVTSPTGNYTDTFYHQGEAAQGKMDSSCTYAPNATDAINATKISCVDNVYSTVPRLEIDPDNIYTHAWVYLMSQINEIYDASGVLAGGTKTIYRYDYNDNSATYYGNLTEKKEYANTADTSTPYRITTTTYNPNNAYNLYIVSLPAQETVTANGVTMADTRYYYNDSPYLTSAPTANKLTMVRTLINGSQYAQTNYDYDDIWGNQIGVTVYTDYGGANSNPSISSAHTTTTTYDGIYHTYPISISNGVHPATTLNYAGTAVSGTSMTGFTLGLPVSQTDANGAVTRVWYDAFGRVIALHKPNPLTGSYEASASLTMTYTNSYPFTTMITETSTGYQVQKKYDGMGRNIEVNAGGILTETKYVDPYTTTQSMPGETNKVTTTKVYPSARQTNVTAPDGTYTATTSNGLVTTFRDARGNITTTTKDVWGRAVSVDAPLGPDITYTYYETDLLHTATRGGVTTTLTYNNAGQKTSMTDPDMGSWTYAYDALGSLISQVDARGCTLKMTYDGLNRLDVKDSFGSCVQQVYVDYDYDSTANGNNGIGRRTSMASTSNGQTVSNSSTYDKRGRVTSETAMGFTTNYAYNSADLPVSMTYPDNEVVTYGYNSRMLLESVSTSLSGNYVSSILYDSAGRMTSRLLGNGLTQNFTYNPWGTQGGRLQSLTATKPDELGVVTLQNVSYVYDAAGNVKTITDSIGKEKNEYWYDPLDRLTDWTLTKTDTQAVLFDEDYQYDAISGNLSKKAGVTFAYTGTQPHAATRADNGTASLFTDDNSYTYDANGNQTVRTVNGEIFNLSYDAENRLVKVEKGTATIATFVYDGDGRRVKATENGITTTFVGAHYELTNGTVTKYYFAGTSRIAMGKYTIPQTMKVEYFLSDHLGSTSVSTDTVGVKVSEMRYKPWGEVRYAWKNDTLNASPAYALTRYTFTGQYSHMDDPSTPASEGFGLMHYGARMYDPALGRFTSADTIVPGGVQGYDRYAYVNNNPIRYNDPTGHMCSDPEDPTPECEGGTRRNGGGSIGNPKSMREYQKREKPELSDELLDIVTGLSGGDQTLVDAWQQLYLTESGYQYAMYIVNNNIRLIWGASTDASYSFCATGGCWIEFASTLRPDIYGDPAYEQEKASELIVTMGHEGYHQAYGHPGYYGSPITDSQAEEFLAFATEYDLAVQLATSGVTNKFEGYYLNDEDSLYKWINDHAISYLTLPPYPPYIPR